MVKIPKIKKFVDNPIHYKILKDFWSKLLFELTGLSENSYVDNSYGNGIEILDGNPIYTLKLNEVTGIRIIQYELALENPIFTSWISKTEINDQPFEELVISLQLDDQTLKETIEITQLYLNKELNKVILNGVNEKYDRIWNLKKLSTIITKWNANNVISSVSSVITLSKEDDSLFQHTIKEFAQTYFLTMHQHVEIRNIELHKHFDSFSKNVRCMHSLIFDNTNIDVGIISKTLQIKHNNIQWSAYPDPEKFLNYSKKAEENLDDMNDSMFVYR